MKTTLELPEDLVREVRITAARENRRIKDVVAELLRVGLANRRRAKAPSPPRVRLPLVRTKRAARASDMSPERLHAILLEQEVRAGPQE